MGWSCLRQVVSTRILCHSSCQYPDDLETLALPVRTPRSGRSATTPQSRDLVFYYGDESNFARIIRTGRFNDSVDDLQNEDDGVERPR